MKAESDWPKKDMPIVYISEIFADKREVRLKPISVKNPECIRYSLLIHAHGGATLTPWATI